MQTPYDVIIIGAGPIGLACAIEAKRKNLSYVVFEKGRLVNSIFGYPHYMRFFSTPDLLEIGDVPFIIQGEKSTRYETLEYYRRVTGSYTLNVKPFEKVLSVNGEDGCFSVATEKDVYSCRKVIAAIGYFDTPRMLDVPGEDLPKVSHYYAEPHVYSDRDVLIIGSGNSAVDAALETYRHGARVTLAVRGETLKQGVKYWIRPDIENRIANRERRTFEIQNELVLALTGYKPDFSFLQTIGIEIGDDEYCTPAHDPETYESNRKGIFLAGVVIGGMRTDRWFIENSRAHAKAIFTGI